MSEAILKGRILLPPPPPQKGQQFSVIRLKSVDLIIPLDKTDSNTCILN